MKSILQNEKKCLVCGTTENLHLHHIFFGNANRKISDKNGFTCWLCGIHHNLSNQGVHFNIKLDAEIKEMCQIEFEKTHTREEFMALIGKNYILGD